MRPDGTLILEKSPTTPEDQSEGVLAGIGQLADVEGLRGPEALLSRCESIVHGTTAADNALIQMSGAATGLLVTEGFRDEIEFRRCFKEDIWDPSVPGPDPIARRRVRLEIPERLTAEGDVDVPLDEEAVRKATVRLRAFGVTSIAVVFLHSFLNPVHERRARELILDEYPTVELVSLSHEVYPKPPEFERISTTLVNAFVGPPIVRLPRSAPGAACEGWVHQRAPSCNQFGRGGHAGRNPSSSPRHDQLGTDRGSGCRGSGGSRGGVRRRGERRHGRHQL